MLVAMTLEDTTSLESALEVKGAFTDSFCVLLLDGRQGVSPSSETSGGQRLPRIIYAAGVKHLTAILLVVRGVKHLTALLLVVVLVLEPI